MTFTEYFSKEIAHLQNPKLMQDLMEKFFKARGINITQQKIAAKVTRQNSLQVAGLSVASFFASGNPTTAGATNMISFVPPEGEHQIIFGIKAFEGVDADVNQTDWLNGLVSAELKNGQFNVMVNGVQRLAPTPLTVFGESQANYDDNVGMYMLDEPIIWPGQQPLTLNCSFPVVPIADQNLRFELVGIGLI